MLEDPDSDLALTRSIRLDINNALMKNGIPGDPEVVSLLLTNLKDLDKVSLTRKKIKSDESKQNNSAEMISLIGKVLTSINNTSQAQTRTSVPMLEDKDYQFVSGEKDTAIQSEDIESFKKRMYSDISD